MLARWFEGIFPVQDPILIFAIVLILMLGAPALLGRFKLPGMIGLLLAGAILGPNALGVLARDKAFVLFGTVGLIYIMFTAALEIDLAVFKKYKLQGIGFGVLTFAIPQGLGLAVGKYLLGFSWPAAILFGSLFASHTLLAYPMASKLGLAKNRAVIAAIGGTMLTDVAALLVLAVIAGSASGEIDEAFWWRLGISLTVYVVAILVGLPRLGRWFFRRVREDGVAQFVFVLTSVFICASLAHTAGVEPIVGAFLAGLAINRLIPHHGPLMNRIQFTGDAIFIPFFLISVGMLIDPAVIFGGVRTAIVAVCMLGSVVVAKWLAAHGAGFLFRYSREEKQVMFGLSVAQAAATLAAVMVGFEVKLFDETVVNGSLVMILGTCILAPLVVDKNGSALAKSEAGKEDEEDADGSVQRLLVPIPDLESSRSILEFAMLFREPSQGQPIFPLGVVLEGGEDTEAKVAKNERTLKHIAAQLSAAEVPIHPMTRVESSVASAIAAASRDHRITDVLVAWDGVRSAKSRRFGSVLDEVLLDRERTLIVTRLPSPLGTTERVLVAIEPRLVERPEVKVAIGRAKKVARMLGAALVVLSEQGEVKAVKSVVKDVKPSMSVTFEPLVAWSSLAQALTDRVKETDLVVLLESREGTTGPMGERLSLVHDVASRFPEANVLAIYAAEATANGSDAPLPMGSENARVDAQSGISA